MSKRLDNFKFVWNNFFKPYGKITIQLGSSEIALRYKKYFNQRSWRRLFIPNKKYNCAVLNLRNFATHDDYLTTVKGKNSADYFSRRSSKLGYYWKVFNANEYIDAIYEINTSASNRQGRTMDTSYLTKVTKWPNDEQNAWIGVFNQEDKLVSYIWLVLTQELALMNRILGHGDYLKDNIMYLNNLGVISYLYEHKKQVHFLMYDTFGRTQNGLALFKKRIGFKPYTVNFV
ncbi:MAG TPA: hypothetical protein PLP27_02530 [Crocinitomicaceae bacterium]|nr:hypothetical protein [Crocinitomicaceae bacterium]